MSLTVHLTGVDPSEVFSALAARIERGPAVEAIAGVLLRTPSRFGQLICYDTTPQPSLPKPLEGPPNGK